MQNLPPSSSAPKGDERLLACLSVMVREGASDMFLLAGAPPTIKCQGVFVPVTKGALSVQQVHDLVLSVLTPEQAVCFERQKEFDLAFEAQGVGRFRLNLLVNRGQLGMVVRHVPETIASLAELGLPTVLADLVMQKTGLILAVGSAGAGKTTMLASMLDHRNRSMAGHILTIEDPIEYLHSHQRSLVTQREIGIDTLSFDEALRHAMREAPDVILIGEIRDRDTMQHAMHYAESGHLCLATLHASNASMAIQRIVNFFAEHAREQLLSDLSLNLRAVIAQRLVPGVHGQRVPANEVLLKTPYIADLIQKGQLQEIRSAIAKGGVPGMASFDQSLFALWQLGSISAEQALEYAESRTDLKLRLRLSGGVQDTALGVMA